VVLVVAGSSPVGHPNFIFDSPLSIFPAQIQNLKFENRNAKNTAEDPPLQ